MSALRTQRDLITALVRFVTRRGGGDGDDGRPLPYGRGIHTRAVALFSASMALVVVVEFAVPWVWVEIPLVVTGAYGGVLAAGLLASHHAHPHLLTADRLRLRHPSGLDVHVPVGSISQVAARPAAAGTADPRVFADALVVPVAGQTSLTIDLDPDVAVEIDGTTTSVRQVSVWVDSPDEVIELLDEAVWGSPEGT
ncbi:MAG: hypothetical protein ACXIVQ_04725 [Acidimicrobiales bacterium]